MIILSRREGEAIYIETPTGRLSVRVVQVDKSKNVALLNLETSWTGNVRSVELRPGDEVKPTSLAGLATVHFAGWERMRIKLLVDAPKQWLVHRSKTIQET